MFIVTEGGERGILRQTVSVEGRADSVQEIDDLYCRHAVPDSQSSKAMDFRKRPQHNHIPPLLHISHGIRKLPAPNVLEISFVKHHDDMRRHTREQKSDFIG